MKNIAESRNWAFQEGVGNAHLMGMLLTIFGTCVLAGCGAEAERAAGTQEAVPEVTVAAPTASAITDYEYFTGRVEPSKQVEIRSRVTGFVDKVAFQPGQEIKAGELLVEIDPRPFKAELDKADAQVAFAEAQFNRTKTVLDQQEKLRKQNANSEDDLLKAISENAEANASLKLALAQKEAAEISLSYCVVSAPMAGRTGDSLVDEGNLVTGGPSGVFSSTLLTTIVSVDDVRVSFDIDENTMQRLQQQLRDGKLEVSADGNFPVDIGLALHGDDYPLSGKVQFVNNVFNAQTGTIQLKALCPNPKPERGPRVLTPGMYTRIRLPLGNPRSVQLVPESSLMASGGRRFLYLVGADGKAVRVMANVGSRNGAFREIISVAEEGQADPRPLSAEDKVIVRGLQRVRAGQPVAVASEDAKSTNRSAQIRERSAH